MLKGTGNKKKAKEKVRTYTDNKALVSLTLHAVPAILLWEALQQSHDITPA